MPNRYLKIHTFKRKRLGINGKTITCLRCRQPALVFALRDNGGNTRLPVRYCTEHAMRLKLIPGPLEIGVIGR